MTPDTFTGTAVRLGLMCIAGLSLLSMLHLVELRLSGPNEYVRKCAHIGAGAIGLSACALLSSHWAVLILATLFTGVLAVTRRLGWLTSLHRPAGRSSAVFLFPWAVYAVFVLAQGDGLMFVAPVLVLTIGDTAAALVGRHFGRTRYPLPGNTRTLEGSAALASAAFVSVFALLHFSGAPLARCLIASVCSALAAAVAEVLSPSDTDNFSIPVATWLALKVSGQLVGAPL